MTDQPTQADRERALAVATNLSVCAFGDELTLALCHLALHAENERLRARLTLYQTAVGCRDDDWCEAVTREDAKMEDAQEPKMTETQAETGPSDEPTDQELMKLFDKPGPAFESRLRRLYDAGRASLAGELAEAKQAEKMARASLVSREEALRQTNVALEAEKAAHAETRKQADRFAARLGSRVAPTALADLPATMEAALRVYFSAARQMEAAAKSTGIPSSGGGGGGSVSRNGRLPNGHYPGCAAYGCEATKCEWPF